MDWIGRAQDTDRWRTLVSAVMNLRVPWKAENFLTSCKPVSFSRRNLHRGVSKYIDIYSAVTNLLSVVTRCASIVVQQRNGLGNSQWQFRVCVLFGWAGRLKMGWTYKWSAWEGRSCQMKTSFTIELLAVQINGQVRCPSVQNPSLFTCSIDTAHILYPLNPATL